MSQASRYSVIHFMRRVVFPTLLISFAASLSAAQAEPEPPLQALAGDRFLLGAAARIDDLTDPGLAGLIRRHFNMLTAEVEFMPHRLTPGAGEFDFGPADAVAEFSQRHGLTLMGHMLLWHYRSPRWLFEDFDGQPLSRERALANLEQYIRTVVGHFRGRVAAWAVVNEALSDDPDEFFRPTPAYRSIGDDYISKAFEFAHAADPAVKLYYNDYNLEEPAKLRKVVELIRSLKRAGRRIDAVGVQGHYLLHYPPAALIDDALQELAAEGVEVMITELDVDVLPRTVSGANMERVESGPNPYPDHLPESVQEALAQRYAEIFRVLVNQPAVTAVTFWGSHDGRSWLNDYPVRGRTNHALLFDRELRPKPAWHAVADVLRGGDAAGHSGGHQALEPQRHREMMVDGLNLGP